MRNQPARRRYRPARPPPRPAVVHRDHVDETVAALVASQDGAGQKVSGREAAEHRLAKAEAEIRRFQAAIAAGIDPTALAEINNIPAPKLMEAAEVYGTAGA